MAAHRKPRRRISPDTPSFIAAVIVAILGIALLAFGAYTYATTGSVSLHPTVVVEQAAPAPIAPVVHEDDPAWDCLTMGNRECGPGVETFEDGSSRLSCYADESLIDSPVTGRPVCVLDTMDA